jgi:hypothetical protein
MKTFGWVEVQLHALLTSKLYGDEWSASRPGRFIPYTRWIEGWVSSRVRLDTVKKKRKSLLLLPAIERFEGRSADRMSWQIFVMCLCSKCWTGYGRFIPNLSFIIILWLKNLYCSLRFCYSVVSSTGLYAVFLCWGKRKYVMSQSSPVLISLKKELWRRKSFGNEMRFWRRLFLGSGMVRGEKEGALREPLK